MKDAGRTAWVDAAKGLSILLVVMMYAAYNTGEHSGGIGLLHYVIGFATPFRMPELFLISGLFLSQVIDRPWLRYADRRVVHYFYFYALWMLIMIGLKVGLFAGAPLDALREAALALGHPYGVLWFIYMLGVFGLAAKLLWQARAPHWLVIPAAAALQMAGSGTDVHVAEQFARHFVFFYLGYAAAPLIFRFVEWAEDHAPLALFGLAAWALLNGLLVFSPGFAVMPVGMEMGEAVSPPVRLTLAIAGALALCVSGALLVKLPLTGWLSWIGAHSLVIYLAFTIPMSIFREAAMRAGLITDTNILSLSVLIVSLASPVVLYLVIQRFGVGRFLFERPRWAHIAEARPVGHGLPARAA
ncbi:MAG TPA: acyltransferase family protein [Mesorhizobium sp.]|jgi:uncharacterized membrane protein YcfT|nr:acyltransferase family protein [Mesorhizobium sp.]